MNLLIKTVLTDAVLKSYVLAWTAINSEKRYIIIYPLNWLIFIKQTHKVRQIIETKTSFSLCCTLYPGEFPANILSPIYPSH